MGDLSEHFSRSEFACKCGCGYDSVSPRLVDLLEKVRRVYGPIHITSGCRCESHNAAVGGVADSAHTRGTAADIACGTGGSRFTLVRNLLERGCRRVGIAKTFVHADVDEQLPQSVLWTY